MAGDIDDINKYFTPTTQTTDTIPKKEEKDGQLVITFKEPINVPAYEVQEGDNLWKIAEKYKNEHVDIVNNGNEDIKPGDIVPISSPEIRASRKNIEKAVEYGYGDKYDFEIAKDGDIILTCADKTQIADIVEDLGVSPESLAIMNDFETQEGRERYSMPGSPDNSDNIQNAKVNKGDTIIIPHDNFNPNPRNSFSSRFFGGIYDVLSDLIDALKELGK